MPTTSRPGAPDTPPLPPRRCRLPPALVLPVPHLCPDGTADCLPPVCSRYLTPAPRLCRLPPALSRTGASGTPPLPQRRGRLPPALERPVPHLCPRDGADCIPHWCARHQAVVEPHLLTAAHLALHHSHPPPSPPPCRATSPAAGRIVHSCCGGTDDGRCLRPKPRPSPVPPHFRPLWFDRSSPMLQTSHQLPPPSLALVGMCGDYSRRAVSTAYPADIPCLGLRTCMPRGCRLFVGILALSF